MNGPVVLAAFAERVWHNGVAGFGMFNTVSAIGALAGALLAARLRTLGPEGNRGRGGPVRARPAGGGADAELPSFIVMLVVVGLMTLLFLTSAATAVQLEAGPEVRGRVMALYLPLLLGGHALGGLLAGWLTEQFGVRTGLVVTGALGMLSGAGHRFPAVAEHTPQRRLTVSVNKSNFVCVVDVCGGSHLRYEKAVS